MKKKLKTKYLAGGPPQNSYFGMSRDNTMAMSNLDSVSRGVAGAVSSLNQSQEQQQLDSFKNVANSAMSMIKKKGGFTRKFQTAGACPQGFAWDKASGQCLPDPNWAGSTPGLGVLAEEYLPGMQAAWEGEFQPTDLLAEQKDTGITKVGDIPGAMMLQDKYLTDPNTLNSLQGVEPIVGNIAKQAKRAGKVTDLVEQGVPMASNKINLTGALPGAGLVGAGLAAMATNMTSDKNAATFTRGEKAGTYASGIISGAASGASKFGLLGAVGGGIMGAFGARKAAKEAENVAKGIRREEEALGVASREASKNSWQGQESGFAYKGSTNMNMQGTGARRMKSGGVERVPGGLIVPIKGTNAVEYIGNKHSESKIDGVSGIRIDEDTEVEHAETKQPVQMAKAGGADSSKGKMRDYFFSAFLKLGGKSFAQRHKEILASGGKKSKVQALVQKLAQKQEAVANQNGEKDRSPDTIASPNSISKKYGGIHMYQTAGEEKRDENLNLLGYDIGKGEETGNTYIPTEGSDKEAVKNWEDQQDSAKTYVRFTPSRPSSKDMKKKGKRQKLVSKMYEDAKTKDDFWVGDESDGLALRKGKMSVFDSDRKAARDKGIYKKRKEAEEMNSGQGFVGGILGGSAGLGTTAAVAAAAAPFWPAVAGAALGIGVGKGVEAISNKRKATMPTKYLNNSKVSDKEYENFKLYDTQVANAQSNAVANGVKPETTVNADGSVTVRGAQTADAVKESDGKFRVRDANGNVIAEGTKKNIVESQAQNIVMAEQAKAAKESEGVPAGQVKYEEGKRYITPGVGIANYRRSRPEQMQTSSEEDPSDMNLYTQSTYENGPSPYKGLGTGREALMHLQSEVKAKDSKFNPYQEGTKEYDDFQTKLNATTPEQSANAQSNADASNVTVRDQNYVSGDIHFVCVYTPCLYTRYT